MSLKPTEIEINSLHAESVGWNLGIVCSVSEVSSLMTPQKVISAVATAACVPLLEILGNKRRRDAARPRQIAMLIMRENCQTMSFPDIARQFDRDHTTVLHGIKKAREAVRRNPHWAAVYELACAKLGVSPYAFTEARPELRSDYR